MIYDYECAACNKTFEVIKLMSESAREERCTCGEPATRVWSSKIELHNTKIKDAEYYHAFDKVIKNDYERSEMIKRTGAIEIGNEKPERARYYIERDRKERIRRRWEED